MCDFISDLIRRSAGHRGRREFVEAIRLIESNLEAIEAIDPDLLFNAYREALLAADEAGNTDLARHYASLISEIEPDFPGIQRFL